MGLEEFCAKYKYELKDSIDWEWDRYGDGYVSVTTLLQLIKDPGFEFVKRNYAEELEAACERGKRIHSEAESFFEGGSATLDLRVMKLHALYGIEVVAQEKTYVKGKVRGTVDLEGRIGRFSGKLMNVDYKSSAKQSMKYHLQLTGYEWLNGNPGAIAYLGERNKFELVLVDSDSLMPAFLELKDYFFTLLNRSGRHASTGREGS